MESVYTQQNPGKNLDVFRRWYSQAGTPRVAVSLAYDAAQQTCSITLRQRCMPVGVENLQQPHVVKPHLHTTFALGLLNRQRQHPPMTFGANTSSIGRLYMVNAEKRTEAGRVGEKGGVP